MNKEDSKIVYENKYDYDDIKIAVCIQDWFDNYTKKKTFCEMTFEDIAKLVIEIKDNWCADKEAGNLSEEEYAYIQAYAYRYLKEFWEER